MFESASKLKLRFQTNKGLLSTEDLWDLKLTDLNMLAKSLHKQIKDSSEVDFLAAVSQEDTLLKLRFDLVIHVMNQKKAEQQAREEAAERKLQRNKLLEVISKKKDESLESLSLEELEKKVAELV